MIWSMGCNLILLSKSDFKNGCHMYAIMQETYMMDNGNVNYFSLRQRFRGVCVFGCMCVHLLAYLEMETGSDSPFLYPLVKVYAPFRDTVYFLALPFVKYWDSLIVPCHSEDWSTNANLLWNCSIVICIPNQNEESHYKLLPCCSLSRISSFLLSPYSFSNNDPENSLSRDSHSNQQL